LSSKENKNNYTDKVVTLSESAFSGAIIAALLNSGLPNKEIYVTFVPFLIAILHYLFKWLFAYFGVSPLSEISAEARFKRKRAKIEKALGQPGISEEFKAELTKKLEDCIKADIAISDMNIVEVKK